jgi:nucleotide-binding universal stress UspA family protein
MRLAIGRQSIGETLLRTARDIEADMLVAGAAYHTRVREFLFGGVTGHVLKHASIPVLMAH